MNVRCKIVCANVDGVLMGRYRRRPLAINGQMLPDSVLAKIQRIQCSDFLPRFAFSLILVASKDEKKAHAHQSPLQRLRKSVRRQVAPAQIDDNAASDSELMVPVDGAGKDGSSLTKMQSILDIFTVEFPTYRT